MAIVRASKRGLHILECCCAVAAVENVGVCLDFANSFVVQELT